MVRRSYIIQLSLSSGQNCFFLSLTAFELIKNVIFINFCSSRNSLITSSIHYKSVEPLLNRFWLSIRLKLPIQVSPSVIFEFCIVSINKLRVALKNTVIELIRISTSGHHIELSGPSEIVSAIHLAFSYLSTSIHVVFLVRFPMAIEQTHSLEFSIDLNFKLTKSLMPIVQVAIHPPEPHIVFGQNDGRIKITVLIQMLRIFVHESSIALCSLNHLSDDFANFFAVPFLNENKIQIRLYYQNQIISDLPVALFCSPRTIKFLQVLLFFYIIAINVECTEWYFTLSQRFLQLSRLYGWILFWSLV